MTHNKLET